MPVPAPTPTASATLQSSHFAHAGIERAPRCEPGASAPFATDDWLAGMRAGWSRGDVAGAYNGGFRDCPGRDAFLVARRFRFGSAGSRAPARLAAAFPLVAPAVARAHLRAGTVAVDYRASIAPDDEAAFTARVYQSDRAIAITVHPGHTVVVLGYLGEPLLRLGPAGVAVNAASPTSVGAGVLSKGDFVRGRMTAWRVQPGRHSVVWHDARVQGLPPGITRGPWSVPLLVDGRRRRLTGELVRGRRPAIWTWAAAAALLACAVLALTLFRPASRLRSSLVLAGVGRCCRDRDGGRVRARRLRLAGDVDREPRRARLRSRRLRRARMGAAVGTGPSGDRARLALRRRRDQQGRGLSSPDRAVVASRDRPRVSSSRLPSEPASPRRCSAAASLSILPAARPRARP